MGCLPGRRCRKRAASQKGVKRVESKAIEQPESGKADPRSTTTATVMPGTPDLKITAGVIQISQQFCFPLESSDAVCVFGKLFRLHLDYVISTELLVLDPIHLTYPAFADFFYNAVMRDIWTDFRHVSLLLKKTYMLLGFGK